MTGTGTQSDPYIVTTWEEFIQAINAGSYIKLGNDINAPNAATRVNMDNVKSLDGDGHAIYNLFIESGYGLHWGRISYISHSVYISNISFLNVNSQGDGLIYTYVYDSYITKINNVVISGFFSDGDIIHISNRDGSDDGNVSQTGFNIKTNSSSLKLVAFNRPSAYMYTSLPCSFINAKIDYGSIEISADSTPLKVTSLDNSKIELNFPTDGNIINLDNLKYCAIIGNGAGVKITSTQGINIVENTLPIDTNSTGTNYSLSTADIKNQQVLYNLGFPCSGIGGD